MLRDISILMITVFDIAAAGLVLLLLIDLWLNPENHDSRHHKGGQDE